MHATQGCAPFTALTTLHPGWIVIVPYGTTRPAESAARAPARVLNLKSPAACVPLGTAVKQPRVE